MADVLVKTDGTTQRKDTTLSLPIALALTERIKSGLSLYPSGGTKLILPSKQGDEETLIELAQNTLSGWIVRQNVIPETGETLRDFLDRAREDYRKGKEAARQAEIRERAEEQLLAISNIMINSKEPDITRHYRWKDGKRVLMGEVHRTYGSGNPQVLAVVLKAVMFALERLSPEQYSPKLTANNVPAMFSLTDLRRYREAKEVKNETPEEISETSNDR